MINIRKASCVDSRIISQLLHKKYSFQSPEEAEGIFLTECQNNHFRIVEDGEKVIGLISWRIQGILNHGVIELARIAVDPDILDPTYVKEMLFDVMVAEADYYYKKYGFKLRKIYSLIHEDNRVVKDFFIDKGMEQEAVLRDHYRRGQDELVFSMFLA